MKYAKSNITFNSCSKIRISIIINFNQWNTMWNCLYFGHILYQCDGVCFFISFNTSWFKVIFRSWLRLKVTVCVSISKNPNLYCFLQPCCRRKHYRGIHTTNTSDIFLWTYTVIFFFKTNKKHFCIA